ncbi:MAG TPA: DUF222 domain-containing protein [Pseudonocardiaceae bacterium]|nr:DUF222 domain-containing protein [Pseudonocardiaceae bacterium]
MAVRQVIPANLAQMAPGPQLSALLAAIDISALTGSDVVEVLRARARQLSHEQARLLATMVEVGLCDPDANNDEVARLAESPPYAADEIRAALSWTRRAADRELDFAETLVVRMPAVFTALEAGKICRSKAWVLADLCSDLTPEQIDVICARVLPHAEKLTTGELAARIKKLAIALDPQWAARRYATAVRERNVIGYLDPDGTATVTGTGLPVEQAATACAHVEELARAAKRAGHPSRIGPLRADIYLGLLEGRWQHHTRDEIITDLLTNAICDAESAANPDHPGEPDLAPATDATAGDSPTAGRPRAQRVGVEVRVNLSTLLGLDQQPGEVPGWGPVPAHVARTIVAAQRAAEWRFAITDPAGQLLLAGITRRRPITSEHATSAMPPCRGGIVELRVPAAQLADLATNREIGGAWAGIVADLAAQYAQHIPARTWGPNAQDPTARFAGAALRRHVQIRDRFCVYPGCRATARSADLDHTLDHVLGGLTTEINSGPLCRHDHRLKTVGRWRLHQSVAGHFTWRSPLGRTYYTQPPPITHDLPEPRPRPSDPSYVAPAFPEDDETPILERPPPAPAPPLPPTTPPDSDEPAPF